MSKFILKLSCEDGEHITEINKFEVEDAQEVSKILISAFLQNKIDLQTLLKLPREERGVLNLICGTCNKPFQIGFLYDIPIWWDQVKKEDKHPEPRSMELTDYEKKKLIKLNL